MEANDNDISLPTVPLLQFYKESLQHIKNTLCHLTMHIGVLCGGF
jgi:hypothetical protein